MRIAGLPVWGPTDMITAARAVLGWTDEAVGVVATLPARVDGLLGDAEALVGRLVTVVEHVEALVGRADGIVGDIDGVLAGARRVVACVDTVLVDAETMVRRVDPLLGEVHAVAGRASGLVTDAGEVAAGAALLISRADGVTEGAAGLVGRAGTVADQAKHLVGEAGVTSRGASEILDLYRPIAHAAAPLAQRFVEDFTEAELQAAIRMVDQLPQLTHHLETDIMPILVTLDRVGPDVHELLDVLQDVRHAIQGVPGFRRLRRRGEEKEREDEEANR